MARIKDTYDERVAKIKDNKEILQRRRTFIRAVQNQFGLSDADLKSITKRDIRLMTNAEFHTFLDNIRNRSELLSIQRQARNELVQQINDKNLNMEPLREAMGLPRLNNMTTVQLRQMNAAITPYMKDDVFLSKRKLETIHRTELEGIKTYREARERLAKKLGITVPELNTIKISEFDRFKGQAALSEKDPFFRMVVEDTAKLRFIREAEYLEIEEKTNNLARKIKTTFLQKLIPQQKNIRKWFEATDKSTVELTKEEADLVKFMQDEWIKALEYLIKEKALVKGIKSENYFTHIRRGILEAVKEDGVIKAFKEVFDQYKLDEQGFDILDTQTGQIMALDKFFRYAMRRTGGLKPTENIVGAFLTYMKTLKKKQALDEIVPIMDIYAHALTPKGLTKKGLLLHGSMIRFMKEWLNTQKGRRITMVAKQGGKIEWGLKATKAFTTLLDIGLNIPVTIATQIGETAVTFQLLGAKKMALAYTRLLNPFSGKGRRIVKKYRNFTGKSPWRELIEPMRSIGERVNEGIFTLFQDANVRRNEIFLLGSLTKEELATETISPKRLAELKIAVSRYGVISDTGSIVGATPEAKTALQYKSWAVPILGSQFRNVKYMAKYLASFGKQDSAKAKRAFVEAIRMLELGGVVLIVASAFIDEDDDSFLGKLKKRAYTEALTLYGAGLAVFTTPRLISFMEDLAVNIGSILRLETYKEEKFGDYKEGDLKGVNRLIKMFTPRAIKQFQDDKVKELEDIRKEIKEDVLSGRLSLEAAYQKAQNEIKKYEDRIKKERFAMPEKEYKANLKARIADDLITQEEAMKEAQEYFEENVDSFKSPDEETFINKVILYATAIGTDPVTAFALLFQGEEIRKIENGTIIVQRMPLKESQEIKSKAGVGKGFILDHTIPLELGGSNNKNNLKLVPEEDWASYTEIENYLGSKLRAGLIDKKTAQMLIKDFKNGKIKREDIIK